jgi:hypothetical protein
MQTVFVRVTAPAASRSFTASGDAQSLQFFSGNFPAVGSDSTIRQQPPAQFPYLPQFFSVSPASRVALYLSDKSSLKSIPDHICGIYDLLVFRWKSNLQLHFDTFKSNSQLKNPGRNIFEKKRAGRLGRRSRMEEIGKRWPGEAC